jgi:hypothetical protein
LARRTLIERDAGTTGHLHMQLAQDHLLSLMDAELAWVARALQRLQQRQEEEASQPTATAARCPGMQADDQA